MRGTVTNRTSVRNRLIKCASSYTPTVRPRPQHIKTGYTIRLPSKPNDVNELSGAGSIDSLLLTISMVSTSY